MRVMPSVAWPPLGDGPWTPPSVPGAAMPDSCDVAIVGGGVTGLSAAVHLASSGKRVVVLDRRFGEGAAIRSGGIIVGDTLIGPAPGFDGCERDLRAWIDEHHVRCGLSWHGCWEMDRDTSLPATPVDWRDAGPIRVSKTIDGGTLDPARLIEGLASFAAASGALLVEDACVTDYISSAGGVEISGSGFRLHARHALVAVDAAGLSTAHDRWPARQLTVALMTAPVADDVADAIGWRERLPFYTNDLPLLWGRGLDTGGMIVGRELIDLSTLHGAPDAMVARAIRDAGARLTARVRGLHPALASIEIDRIWAGPIARDAGGVPSLSEDADAPGVWWAGGYGGHGLAQAFRLGTTAAQRIQLAGESAG